MERKLRQHNNVSEIDVENVLMKLFIYGSGGYGKEVLNLALRNNRWKDIAFINDFEEGKEYYGYRFYSFESIKTIEDSAEIEIVIGTGEPVNRKILYTKVKEAGYRLATIIDKDASVSPFANIGEGCIISAHVNISADPTVGVNCAIQPNVSLGHDTLIGDHCVLSPTSSISGNCVLGSEVFLGTGACIKERLRIGDRSIIAMGAMVFRDVAENSTVIGNPARVTKSNDSHKVF